MTEKKKKERILIVVSRRTYRGRCLKRKIVELLISVEDFLINLEMSTMVDEKSLADIT